MTTGPRDSYPLQHGDAAATPSPANLDCLRAEVLTLWSTVNICDLHPTELQILIGVLGEARIRSALGGGSSLEFGQQS